MRPLHGALWAGLLPLSWLATACQSEPLDDASDVRVWATTASAVAVYSNGYGPIAFADGQSTFDDPACPQTHDDGTTVSIVGGCTDSTGKIWVGSATVVRSASGDRVLTLDGYGSFDDPDQEATMRGTVTLRQLAPSDHSFSVDLVHEGGMTTTFSYSGRVEGDYGTTTKWNGSGQVEREGPLSPTGTIDATTVDEVVDDSVCSGQPVSGQTTLRDEDHTTVITYDGATDCDPDQAARWRVDREDRGLISGISCTASAAGARGPGFALPCLLAALVLGRRARRRPC